MKRLDIFAKTVKITRHEDVFGNVRLTAEYKEHRMDVVLAYRDVSQESDVRFQLKRALQKRVA